MLQSKCSYLNINEYLDFLLIIYVTSNEFVFTFPKAMHIIILLTFSTYFHALFLFIFARRLIIPFHFLYFQSSLDAVINYLLESQYYHLIKWIADYD